MKGKIVYLTYLLFIVAIAGCRKQDPVLALSGVSIDKFSGYFCGDNTQSNGGWSIHNTTLEIVNLDSNIVKINNFIGSGEDIEVVYNNGDIIIPEQIFSKEATSQAWGHLYFYDLHITGNGTYDTANHILTINYEKLEIRDDSTERLTTGIVKMYNSSKFDIEGSYEGDNAFVEINKTLDSLEVSVSISTSSGQKQWNNIKVSYSPCNFKCIDKTYTEQISGNTGLIWCNGSLLGNRIDMSFREYLNDNSGFTWYNFTVYKK